MLANAGHRTIGVDVNMPLLEDIRSVLVTDHAGFRDLDPRSVAARVRRKIAIDTRNPLDRNAGTATGFVVRTLGVSQTPIVRAAFSNRLSLVRVNLI
jgi:hypothetical protein